MQSSMTRYTPIKEDCMERPDLRTLACVNPECQQFRQAGQGNLVIRKVYGPSGTMGPIDYATSVRRVRHWPFPKQTGITAAPGMHHGGLQCQTQRCPHVGMSPTRWHLDLGVVGLTAMPRFRYRAVFQVLPPRWP